MPVTDSYSEHPAQGPNWRPASYQRPIVLVPSRQPSNAESIAQGPFTFTGSARRIWNKLVGGKRGVARTALAPLAGLVIMVAWVLVVARYALVLLFTAVSAPWRLVRRGPRPGPRPFI